MPQQRIRRRLTGFARIVRRQRPEELVPVFLFGRRSPHRHRGKPGVVEVPLLREPREQLDLGDRVNVDDVVEAVAVGDQQFDGLG